MIIGYIRNVGVKDTLYGIRRYDQNDDSFENGRVYDQAYYGRKILEEWKRVTDPVELKMIKLLLML